MAIEVVVVVQEQVEKVIQMASEHMIEFDPEKSELLVIGRGPRKKLDPTGLKIQIKEHKVVPSPVVSWLGV